MAETKFEQDIRGMFDQPAALPDGAAFTVGVERRLDRARWLRIGLLIGFGLVGLALTVLLSGASLGQFEPLVGGLTKIVTGAPGALGDTGSWVAALLLLLIVGALARPVLSDS